MSTVYQRLGLWTDRWTDGRTTNDSNTALAPRALRGKNVLQESRAVAREPRDAAAVVFGL